MDYESKWVSEEANQAILDGITSALEQVATDRGDLGPASKLMDAISTSRSELEKDHEVWVADDQSRFHVRFMSLLVAALRTIASIVSRNEAIGILKQAVVGSGKEAILEGVAYALESASDPMTEIVSASKERETMFFGSTFGFERYRDDRDEYILHVTKCFYHRFAVANAAPELMEILCEWDWIWAGAIEPMKHGFSFELPTTLGRGGDVCRFCFRRLSPASVVRD